MDTLTKARGLFILMWQDITKTITMESFPDVTDDVINTTRELDGQQEKHNPADFALTEMCPAGTYHALAVTVE